MNIDEFSATFRFFEHSITNLSMENSTVSFEDEMITKKIFDLDYEIEHMSKDENRCLGVLRLNITTIIECLSEEKEGKGCQLQLSILGFFEDAPDCEEELFERTLCHSGAATLYSIARSIIIDISSKAAFAGSIRLPMINVYAFNEAKKNRKEKETTIQKEESQE